MNTRAQWREILYNHDLSEDDFWYARINFADWCNEQGKHTTAEAWRHVVKKRWRCCNLLDYSKNIHLITDGQFRQTIEEKLRHLNKWVWFRNSTDVEGCAYYKVAVASNKNPEAAKLPYDIMSGTRWVEVFDSYQIAERWLINRLIRLMDRERKLEDLS